MTGGVRLLAGTSGWNYDEWRGAFYPPDLPAARRLAWYAERLPTVEVNATFYRMPTPRSLGAWAAAVPPTFVLALKAPQRLTHVARLAGVDEPLRAFVDAARTLGPRLGPLLFQLPPAFPADPARLADVLGRVPAGVRVAFEFRHPSWFADAVYARLRAGNAALCIADTEAGATPAVATADWGYLRLRAGDYAEADLARWLATIRRVGAAWSEAFVYFKHEARATGPALARRLLELAAR